MKKSEFVQFSCALHPDHIAWLRSKKSDGYNMSALIRQALDEVIEKYDFVLGDDDFCDSCGGGQGYHDMVELPVEGSPEAEALKAWLKEKEAGDPDKDKNETDDKIPF